MSTVRARRPDRRREHVRERVRERIRNAFWVIPGLIVAASLVLGLLARAAELTVSASVYSIEESAAVTLLAAIAASTLTFVGVLFAATVVALQLASQQMSPRVLRVYARSNITKVTFGVITGTYAFAIFRLATLELTTDPDESAASLSVFVALVMTAISLGLFFAFADQILGLMRVERVIDAIARETKGAIDSSFPPESAYFEAPDPPLGETVHTVLFHRARWTLATVRGSHGLLIGVDRSQLVDLGAKTDSVLTLVPRIGWFVSEPMPVVDVHGGTAPDDGDVLVALDVGAERNLYQDPMFGIRMIVDIAAQSSTPSVNAPTTVIRALDHLGELVGRIGVRPDSAGRFADDEGHVRLLETPPTWDEVTDLAFSEIRDFGAASSQVTRRMEAIFETLIATLPTERHAAVERHRGLLRQSVARAFPDPDQARFALTPNHSGLG